MALPVALLVVRVAAQVQYRMLWLFFVWANLIISLLEQLQVSVVLRSLNLLKLRLLTVSFTYL